MVFFVPKRISSAGCSVIINKCSLLGESKVGICFGKGYCVVSAWFMDSLEMLGF